MATKEPFRYLLTNPDCLQYCSSITESGPTVFYLPSDKAETTPLTNEKEEISVNKQMVHLQPNQLKKYLRSCDSDVILVICECLHNVLLGQVRVKLRA